MPKVLIEKTKPETRTVNDVSPGDIFEDHQGNIFLRMNDRFVVLKAVSGNYGPVTSSQFASFGRVYERYWNGDHLKIAKVHGPLEVNIQ